jgi:hypothetical protein
MDSLSYLSTFLSLILGLAVANVLAHLSSMVKQGREAEWYFLHTMWAVYLLFLVACEWWIIFEWSMVGKIGFWTYLFRLTKPCVLFVASDVLFPDKTTGASVDLKAHFWSVRRRLLLIVALYPALDVVDTMLKGMDHVRELGATYPIVLAVGFLAVFVGIKSENERVHLGILMILFVGVALSMSNALSAV